MIQWGQAKGKGGRREGKMSEVERNEGMKEERREGGREGGREGEPYL